MSTLQYKINPVLGAEISGLDLTQAVDNGTRAELNALFSKHAVLVFQDQPLSPPQFMQAAKIFGSLMDQQFKKFTLPDYPLVGSNSTKDLPRKNGKLQVRGENYHTDHSNDIAPPKATACWPWKFLPMAGTRSLSTCDGLMTICLPTKKPL